MCFSNSERNNAKTRREFFLLFSIWGEATKNEVENKRTRNKRKYFWSVDYEKEKANKEEILWFFLNNKQKRTTKATKQIEKSEKKQIGTS